MVFFGVTGLGYTSKLKALEASWSKKTCELIITEHFLNIPDHENFFPKEILLDFSQDNSVSRNIVWNMML